MIQFVNPQPDFRITVGDAEWKRISPQDAFRLAAGPEEMTPERARQVLTGCFLMLSSRMDSGKKMLLDFRKL
jgi:hypothetical protein